VSSYSIHQSKTLIRLLAKANQLRHQEDYQAAIAVYLEAVNRFGESAELLSTIANCYFALDLGNPPGADENLAVAWMEKAVALVPDSGPYRANLAQFYALGVLDYETAAQQYRIAIELAPTLTMALAGAASLYGVPENVVSLEEAIGWLERVAQLDPSDPNCHFRLGQLYFEAGRLTEGKTEWLRALTCPQPIRPYHAQTIESILAGSD